MIDLSGLQAELAKIDENLIRNDLDLIDRGEHLKRRKEIYEAIHPETKAGQSQSIGMNKSLGNNVTEIISPTFVDDTAKKTGVSTRVIHEEIQIATNLTPESKERLRFNVNP